MSDARVHASGVEVSLRIGQHVRHRDYKGRRVTGIVEGLSIEHEQGLMASVVLDEPLVIPPVYEGDREIHIHRQTAQAHEFSPFDEREELIVELLAALVDLHKVAYVTSDEHYEPIARAAAVIAKATGSAS